MSPNSLKTSPTATMQQLTVMMLPIGGALIPHHGTRRVLGLTLFNILSVFISKGLT